MSDTITRQRWIAVGPAGTVAAIHRTPDGFVVKMVKDGKLRGHYSTLNAAKSAVHAAMGADADWPEFREH